MTLEEFIEDYKKTMSEPVEEFRTMWLAENSADPEAYPLEMDQGEWSAKFLPFFLSVAAKRMGQDFA